FKRHGLRRKSPAREFEDNAGVFAARKQQAYLVELASHLAQDVDGFILQVLQVWRESSSHEINNPFYKLFVQSAFSLAIGKNATRARIIIVANRECYRRTTD